jgi:5'-nucleotidase
MRILLTNDDGVHGEGLVVLTKIAQALSNDVWVVAPQADQSGASHSITLQKPLRIQKIGEKKFGVTGTPTDCVLVGVHHLMKGQRPDLILSGVNYGGNSAEDVTYSGTVAAAMEATLLGIPSIALSQVIGRPEPAKWDTAQTHAVQIIEKILQAGIPEKVLMNVNFPNVMSDAVKGVRTTCLGNRKILDNLVACTDPRGKPYYWLGSAEERYEDFGPPKSGSDLEAIMDGYISVTPLCLDLTHSPTFSVLQGVFTA